MSKHSGDPAYPQETAQMEQVRELLFGAQLKDMETRFKRQEERFLREMADTRDALKTRLDSLENFMKSETSSTLHRLKEEQGEREETLKAEQRERSEGFKSEQRERSEAVAQVMKELGSSVEALERKIAKVSSTLDTTERELRQLLLSESSGLSTAIDEKYQESLRVIANTASQIRHDMVHRSALSGMLTEVAVKLSGQWTSELGSSLYGAGAADAEPATWQTPAPDLEEQEHGSGDG